MMVIFASGIKLDEGVFVYDCNGFLVRAGKLKFGEEAFRGGVSLGVRIKPISTKDKK